MSLSSKEKIILTCLLSFIASSIVFVFYMTGKEHKQNRIRWYHNCMRQINNTQKCEKAYDIDWKDDL
jgi:hypothetical protein